MKALLLDHRKATAAVGMLMAYLVGTLLNRHPALMFVIALAVGLVIAFLLDLWAGEVRLPWSASRRAQRATFETQQSVKQIWGAIRDTRGAPLPLILVIGRQGVGKTSVVRHLAGEREAKEEWHLERFCSLWRIPDLCWLFEVRHGLDEQHASGRIVRELLAGSPSVERKGVIAGIVLVETPGDLRESAQQVTADLRRMLIADSTVEGTAIPVWIVLTQCDRLLGGEEMFQVLETQSKQRPDSQAQLGFWLQPAESIKDALDRFREEVGTLVTEYCEAPTWQLGERQEALEFAFQLFQLSNSLNVWVDRLVRGEHREDPTIFLTGVFFGAGRVSADEEGKGAGPKTATRVDLVESPISVDRAIDVEWTPVGGGFGLGRPFRKFVEVVASRRAPDWVAEVVERHSWMPVFAVIVACVLALGAWSGHQGLLDELRTGWNQAQREARGREVEALKSIKRTEALRPSVELALRHLEGERTGLRRIYHRSPETFELARQMYVAAFRDAVGDRLVAWAASTIPVCTTSTPECVHAQNLYRLLTVSDEGDSESGTFHDNVRLVTEQWVADLARAGFRPEDGTEDVLEANVELLVHLLEKSKVGLARQDPRLISASTSVRVAPNRGALAVDDALSTARRRVESACGVEGVSLESPWLRAPGSPPALYTTCAWRRETSALLSTAMRGVDRLRVRGGVAGWSESAVPNQCTLVEREYASRHVAAWVAFLNAARVVAPRTLDESIQMLSSLSAESTEHHAPFRTLLQYVLQNGEPRSDPPRARVWFNPTTWFGSSTELPCVRGTEAEIQRQFAPVRRLLAAGEGGDRLGQYHHDLEGVQEALRSSVGAPANEARVTEALARAESRLAGYLGDVDSACARALRTLLTQPLDHVRTRSRATFLEEMDRGWCRGVVAVHDENLSGMDPATAGAREFEAMNRFFARDGVLWRFVELRLQGYVEQGAAGYQIASNPAARSTIAPSLQAYLTAVEPLRRAYGAGGSSPRIAFAAQLLPDQVDVDLSVDGQLVSTRGQSSITWPGTGFPLGALVRRHGELADETLLERAGPWGWIKLLMEGQRSPRSGNNQFEVTWALRDGTPLRARLRVTEGAEALLGREYALGVPGLFHLPDLPRSITQQRHPCPRARHA